jgi:O-antigen/teichoic acid export membrane protein
VADYRYGVSTANQQAVDRLAAVTTTLPARSSIASNALAMFGGQVGTWLVTALIFLLIPRYLGPEGTGVMGIGWMFAALGATAAGLGMTPMITREVARDPNAARGWIGTAIWVNVALGTLAAVVSLVLAVALGYRPLILFSVALHALLIPAMLVSGIGSAILQGLEVMRYAAAFGITIKLGVLVAAIIAIVGDMGLVGVLVLTTAVPLVIGVVQVAFLLRIYSFRLFSFSRSTALTLCRVSIPFFVITVAWAIYHSIDVLLLSLLATESDVGYYSAPARIFGTLLFIPSTIAIVTFPRFAATHRERPENIAQMADKVLRITFATGIVVTLGAIALSDDLLIGLLGAEFAKAGPVIVVMAIGLVPTGIGAVLARMAFAMDRQKRVALIGILAIPARFLLAFALIAAFDREFDNPALGAVVGFVLAETVVAVAMLQFTPRGTFSSESMVFYLKVSFATVAGVVVLAVLWETTGSFLGGALGGLVFCAGVLVSRAYTIGDVVDFARTMSAHKVSPASGTA